MGSDDRQVFFKGFVNIILFFWQFPQHFIGTFLQYFISEKILTYKFYKGTMVFLCNCTF
jgi:hypothetical protein